MVNKKSTPLKTKADQEPATSVEVTSEPVAMPVVDFKPPKLEVIQLCDDIREEKSGKISLMGIYDGHLVVQQVPTVMTKICFHAQFSRMVGEYKMKVSIIYPDGEKERVILDGVDISIPEQVDSETHKSRLNVTTVGFEIPVEGLYKIVYVIYRDDKGYKYEQNFRISSLETIRAKVEEMQKAQTSNS